MNDTTVVPTSLLRRAAPGYRFFSLMRRTIDLCQLTSACDAFLDAPARGATAFSATGASDGGGDASDCASDCSSDGARDYSSGASRGVAEETVGDASHGAPSDDDVGEFAGDASDGASNGA